MIDASVLFEALVTGGATGEAARTRLAEDGDLRAPHLIDLEMLSALRGRVEAGSLSASRALDALRDLSDLPVHRYPHLPFARRIWELRANLTTYDACYVALAESLACTLVTLDGKLSRAAGIRCDVEVLQGLSGPLIGGPG